MKKNAIITFDYEVFLGRETGTIENSLFKPTRLILNILIKNNAKAIFFVDATWLLFLKENFTVTFELVSEQLKEIVKSGSSVELHLHPQWLQAHRLGGKIEFKSFENYRLHSLSQDQILALFGKSIELLENITLQKITCFRAGGFCIEPFIQIKNAFETFGIVYDFSVAPGMLLTGGNEYDYDFSHAPCLSYYHFQNNIQIPETGGEYIEIPLSTYHNNPLYRLTNKLLLKLTNDKIHGDGKGIQEVSNFFWKSFSRRLRYSKTFLSIDKTSHAFFKFLIKAHFNQSQFIVIISHPKILSKQALHNLSYITENYNTTNSINLKDFVSENEIFY